MPESVKHQNDDLRIVRLNRVIERTGLCRSAIYAKIAAGEFPSQINLGPRSVGWVETDISEWISNRIDQSRRAKTRRKEAR